MRNIFQRAKNNAKAGLEILALAMVVNNNKTYLNMNT